MSRPSPKPQDIPEDEGEYRSHPGATVDAVVEDAPAAAAANVTLQVTSHVARARVRLDGVLVGETPLAEIAPRSAGQKRVTVEADGHAPWETMVVLDRDQQLEVVLTPRAAEAPVDEERGDDDAAPRGRARARKGRLFFNQDPYR
jgi:hypothetical protein